MWCSREVMNTWHGFYQRRCTQCARSAKQVIPSYLAILAAKDLEVGCVNRDVPPVVSAKFVTCAFALHAPVCSSAAIPPAPHRQPPNQWILGCRCLRVL